MGVYTNVDKPFGLTMTPRLESILKNKRAGESPSEEDIDFLIDEAARFETIMKRVRQEDYMLDDTYLDQKVELSLLLGDLVDELTNVYASKIGQDSTYKLALPHFHPHSEDNIETLRSHKITWEIQNALRMVKEMQHAFDLNNDGLKVEAHFKHLVKPYGVDIVITAESKWSDVAPLIIEKVVAHAEKEAMKKAESIKRLKAVKAP